MKNKKQKENYKTLEQLGSGAYGTVFKAEKAGDGIDGDKIYFAWKSIKIAKEDEGMPSTAIRQIGILKELSHFNIVKLQEVFLEPTELILVFEYLEYDLKKFMNKIPKDVGMDPQLIKIFTYQLIRGVDYCHRKDVLHRDLKPQNLLISKQNILKIADFGLARGFGIPNKGFTHEVVTLWYRAPDVLLQSRDYCREIDVWSIGCILAEMAALRPLFTGANECEQIEAIFQYFGSNIDDETWKKCQSFPGWNKPEYKQILSSLREEFQLVQNEEQPFFEKLGQQGNDLLKKMLQIDPSRRISTAEALKHPYFQDLPQQILGFYQAPKPKKKMILTSL